MMTLFQTCWHFLLRFFFQNFCMFLVLCCCHKLGWSGSIIGQRQCFGSLALTTVANCKLCKQFRTLFLFVHSYVNSNSLCFFAKSGLDCIASVDQRCFLVYWVKTLDRCQDKKAPLPAVICSYQFWFAQWKKIKDQFLSIFAQIVLRWHFYWPFTPARSSLWIH